MTQKGINRKYSIEVGSAANEIKNKPVFQKLINKDQNYYSKELLQSFSLFHEITQHFFRIASDKSKHK